MKKQEGKAESFRIRNQHRHCRAAFQPCRLPHTKALSETGATSSLFQERKSAKAQKKTIFESESVSGFTSIQENDIYEHDHCLCLSNSGIRLIMLEKICIKEAAALFLLLGVWMVCDIPQAGAQEGSSQYCNRGYPYSLLFPQRPKSETD
ncbi:MAG: hypothetical protein R2941_06910 [Desulfobacterales bacterium]